MAYDAQRGYVVLFAGRSGSTNYADTWLWDGNNWTLAGTFYGPAKRAYHHMAYDAERRQVLMFGGFDINVAFYNDLWAWDGLKWNQLQAACNPCSSSYQPFVREGGGMAYDPVRKATILFGGIKWPSNFITHTVNFLDDTWAWDGSAWTPLAAPLHRLGHSMVWDSAHNQAVMFGGWVEDGGYTGSYYETNETWVWNGAAWTLKNPAHKPPPRLYTGMAYDAVRQKVLIFGGLQGSTYLGDMWAWDGNDWTQLTPSPCPPHASKPSWRTTLSTSGSSCSEATPPPGSTTPGRGMARPGRNSTRQCAGPLWRMGMAYDPVRQRVMMAQAHTAYYIDATNNWTALAAPPATFYGVMAWGGPLGKMVYLNAWTGSVSKTYNMWTFDGSSWAQFIPTTMPPSETTLPWSMTPYEIKLSCTAAISWTS